jgi:hypothetical protein
VTGPQDAETLQYENSREASPNQIHIEAASALRGRVPLAGLPIPAGQPVEDLLLRDVTERLGQARFRGRSRHASAAQVLADTLPPEPMMLEPRASVTCGEAAVVEVALRPESLQGVLDLVRLESLAQQGAPQLAGRMVAARKPLQGALIGGLG